MRSRPAVRSNRDSRVGHDENWRVLMVDDVAQHIAGVFATRLTEMQQNVSAAEAEVRHVLLSDVKTIPVRSTSCVEVNKCTYPKLPVPTHRGG